MKKIPLADVLWEAANRWLSPVALNVGARDSEEFSCHAAYRASAGRNWRSIRHASSFYQIDEFLSGLGCEPSRAGFLDYVCAHTTQGVRYMWLLLAMHVAEDEGIMVEVQS